MSEKKDMMSNDYVKTPDIPALQSFAVWFEKISALKFYNLKEHSVPNVGSTMDGNTVTAVYENIDREQFTNDNIPWHSIRSAVISVEIVDKITPIFMDNWFANMTNLRMMSLDNLETGSTVSMNQTFAGLERHINRIDLSQFNLGNVLSAAGMFLYSKVNHIKLGNMPSLLNAQNMFNSCSLLQSIDMSGYHAHIEKISGMFAFCSNIESINLSALDTSNVTDFNHVFSGCLMLAKLTVGDKFVLSKGTVFSDMFNDCRSLKKIPIYLSTGKVGDCTNMFYDCRNLRSLSLVSFNNRDMLTSTGSMNGMFNGCYKLSKVDLGSDFKFKSGTTLPAQSNKNVFDADGKWYIDGTGYTPQGLADYWNTQGRTTTVVASKPDKQPDASKKSSVNYNNLGNVYTNIDAWQPYDEANDTPDTAEICAKSTVYADSVSGWGIKTIRGYELDGKIVEDEATEPEIIDGNLNIGLKRTAWKVPKAHEAKKVRVFVKSVGELVPPPYNVAAYPTNNEVSVELTIQGKMSYIVTYKANADDATGAPAGQKKWHNETLILSSDKPTRPSYEFLGWATSADSSKVAYAPGASYTGNDNLTLYAIWKGKPHTVRYNANGGVGAPSDQLKEYGVNLTLSSTKPTRDGYTFKGWSTSATGSAEYQPGGTYTKDEDVTPYAVWEVITYDVIYNANGGTGAPANQKKRHPEPLILSSTKPTRTGYDFLGWGVSEDDTTVDYAPGASYTANKPITLYAIWQIHTYTVRYDANGGTGAPANQTKQYNVDLALSSAKPTREGYAFKGWATSTTGAVEYQPVATYSKNEAVTLYAVWEIITYTITYDANGGYNAPEKQTKQYGKTVNLSTVKPLKHKSMFKGWATSATGAVAYQPGEAYVKNESVTLYAIWENIKYMKMLNNYEICDEAARETNSGVVTSGTGTAYTVDSKAIGALTKGISFIMIPHVTNASNAPTLNVNRLGAKTLRQRLSDSSGNSTVLGENVLLEGKPVRVVYDGTYWIVDMPKPVATKLEGVVPVASGGTGAADAAKARVNLGINLNNLGITWGTAEPPAKGTPNSIYIQIN